jgi:hypothetical protein
VCGATFELEGGVAVKKTIALVEQAATGQEVLPVRVQERLASWPALREKDF